MRDPLIIDETLKELDLAAQLVNTFAVRAKRYWMGWGPVVGMPMILTIEAWAEGQRWYLEWLRAEVLNLGQTLLEDDGEEASANRPTWPSRLSTPYPPNLHPRLSDPFPPNIRRLTANLSNPWPPT